MSKKWRKDYHKYLMKKIIPDKFDWITYSVWGVIISMAALVAFIVYRQNQETQNNLSNLKIYAQE